MVGAPGRQAAPASAGLRDDVVLRLPLRESQLRLVREVTLTVLSRTGITVELTERVRGALADTLEWLIPQAQSSDVPVELRYDLLSAPTMVVRIAHPQLLRETTASSPVLHGFADQVEVASGVATMRWVPTARAES